MICQSTFEKVSQLNVAFGNPQGDLNNLTEADWVRIEKQAHLVVEEAKEVLKAAQTRDLKELMDGTGDVTTVNDGVAHIAGYDNVVVYNIVHDSNMSKFCPNQDIVDQTLEKYYAMGFQEGELYVEGEFPAKCVKVAHDTTIIFNDEEKFFPQGKFLKSVLFREPDFSPILPSAK
ncbi:PAS domain-containing protein [Vibrio phage vB_VcorM_GR28A]|nr:PAS domain-containing protein [Vibrio phage vB_VcorM_GR28A]